MGGDAGALIADWHRRGYKLKWITPFDTQPHVVGPGNRFLLHSFEEGEGFLRQGFAIFDHPSMGVQVIFDHVDSRQFITVNNVHTVLGFWDPNDYWFSPNQSFVLGVFVLAHFTDEPFEEKFSVYAINTDMAASHTIASWLMNYGVPSAPGSESSKPNK